VVSVEEFGAVGRKGVGGEEGKEKKGREKKKREEKRIGGEKGMWSYRGLSALVFGQNERGR
jgi:hypothetical protein